MWRNRRRRAGPSPPARAARRAAGEARQAVQALIGDQGVPEPAVRTIAVHLNRHAMQVVETVRHCHRRGDRTIEPDRSRGGRWALRRWEHDPVATRRHDAECLEARGHLPVAPGTRRRQTQTSRRRAPLASSGDRPPPGATARAGIGRVVIRLALGACETEESATRLAARSPQEVNRRPPTAADRPGDQRRSTGRVTATWPRREPIP